MVKRLPRKQEAQSVSPRTHVKKRGMGMCTRNLSTGEVDPGPLWSANLVSPRPVKDPVPPK